MPEYADIYSLHLKRDPATIACFLTRFLAGGEVAADEFTLTPNGPEPGLSFGSERELIDHCCRHPEHGAWIPWRGAPGCRPEHGSMEFLLDGSLVLGLATDAEDQDFVDELCEQLGSLEGAVASYITHEDTAPPSAAEFIAFVRTLPVVMPGEDQTEIRACRARRRPDGLENPGGSTADFRLKSPRSS